MKYTWYEYQKALGIQKTFEKERDLIKHQRVSRKYTMIDCNTLSDVCWLKRYELNQHMYAYMKCNEKFDGWIYKLKNDLLKIRLQYYKEKKNNKIHKLCNKKIYESIK